MAKEAEKKQARTLYIDEGLTGKEIAARLKVSEKSLSGWIDQGGWKDIKLSKQSGTDTLIKNYQELLSLLIEKRLKFERKAVKSDEDKADHASCIDEISKIAAAIDRVQKDGQVSLRIHIHCLEKFMNALQKEDRKAFKNLIDFQLKYLDLLAEELK